MVTPVHLLDYTATISTPAYTAQADGSASAVYSDSSTVLCTIQPASSREAVQLARELGVQVWEGYFAPSDSSGTATAISKGALINIGGLTYRSLGPGRDAAGKGVLIVCEMERFT